MWANTQRDGRPTEYRWRHLFNAAKFDWRPLLQCRAVMLPRRETRWNLQGCPKLPDRSQLLVGRSSPYCWDMWRRYCCVTIFLRLSRSGPLGIPILKVKNSPRQLTKFPKIPVVKNITSLVYLSILDLYWHYMFTQGQLQMLCVYCEYSKK